MTSTTVKPSRVPARKATAIAHSAFVDHMNDSIRILLEDLRPGRYAEIWESSSVDLVEAIREGVRSSLIETLQRDMKTPRTQILEWTDIAEATAKRKLKLGARLSKSESEQALGLARLIGQVERIVRESGEPNGFDAATWTANWLAQPNAALGGEAPGKFMDTAEGRKIVSQLIAQMQSGAYA